VKKLVGRHNVLTADLLAHLAEVDARGIYRERSCSSLHTYCVYELRFSEDEAQRRSQAARTARQFPMLFEMLAEGAIHMTGLLLLAPHLTAENCAELLARARFRTKRELERLIAEIAPRADVPSRIEPLGPGPKTAANLWQAYTASLRGRVRDLELGTGRGEAPAPVFDLSEQAAISELNEDLPASALAETPAPAPKETTHHAADSDPVVPLRYRIEFTVGQDYVDGLEEARNLLQRQVPNRDVARVHELAMGMFVEHLRKRRGVVSGARRRVESERVEIPKEGKERPIEDGAAPERISEPLPSEGSAPERIDDPVRVSESAPERFSEPMRAERSAPERTRDPLQVDESAPERISKPLPSEGSAPERIDDPSQADECVPERKTEPSKGSEPAAERTMDPSKRNECVPGRIVESLPPERSAPARMATTSRHIPAAVRRHVWARDGGRCTFSDARGCRCRERSGLEIHHEQPFALGGPPTVENLRLVCRAHNALFAERDFGRAHVERLRAGRRPK
jgi:hypothetical protein